MTDQFLRRGIERPDESVLVVDFGAQYAQLIARRVREAHVYSEIVPHTITATELAAKSPTALIFSGGPKSVHEPGAPGIDPAIYELGVPILGICYGAQLLARDLGGTVAKTGRGEYGRTELDVADAGLLFTDTDRQSVWMSHFDTITVPPTGAAAVASSPETPAAAFEDVGRGIFGVQYHPEVLHTPRGQALLERFLREGAGLSGSWTMASFIDTTVDQVREWLRR